MQEQSQNQEAFSSYGGWHVLIMHWWKKMFDSWDSLKVQDQYWGKNARKKKDWIIRMGNVI
jgi:hypothetical protein